MNALRLDGHIAEALSCHTGYIARLREELDTEPSPEFVALGEELEENARPTQIVPKSPGSAALFTPDLTGRGASFEELATAWRRVQAGASAAVLVEGEQGIGKTRLCEEFVRWLDAATDPVYVLRARTYEAQIDEEWSTATDLFSALRHAPGLSGADADALAELNRLVPSIRERYTELPPATGDARALQRAVVDVLDAVAMEVPVVIFVDDLPWADRASRQLLLALIRQTAAPRVLWLLTGRSDDLARTDDLAELRRLSRVRRLVLQPLQQDELETVVASMLELSDGDRRALAERIHAETGGNPLYAVEILTALVDEGHITLDSDGTWRLSPAFANKTLPLPSTVRDIVSRRMERLSEPARRLAGAAAVLGPAFEPDVVRSVSGAGREEIYAALDELVTRRLVRRVGGSERTYEFTHELVHRAAYHLLPPEQRQTLHQAVGSALESAQRTRGAGPPSGGRGGGIGHGLRPSRWPRPLRWVVAAVLVLATAAGLVGRWTDEPPPLIAVGTIHDYADGDSLETARALADMLATNLARVSGLRVVSSARIYELIGQLNTRHTEDTLPGSAARRAGATELVEGALYRLPDGTLRLDLRRVDLESGAVETAVTVAGRDAFVVTDKATERLARAYKLNVPDRGFMDATTNSFLAYRYYQQGLRVFYQEGDRHGAREFFHQALAEDSTFAMAAYYAALSNYNYDHLAFRDQLRRAVRFADRATDRERLLIRGAWAKEMHEPAQAALAETLSVRYPAEPDGHYLLGNALLWSGDFHGALPHLRRVVAMDSLSLRGEGVRCLACDALWDIVTAYRLADSLHLAERVAREWTELQPRSARAWYALASMLAYQDKLEQALMARRTAASFRSGNPRDTLYAAILALREGAFDRADRMLSRHLEQGSSLVQQNALWYLTLSLRYQGRFREALEMARRYRQVVEMAELPAQRRPFESILEALVLMEMGRGREAAVLFRRMAAYPYEPDSPPRTARHKAWTLTHAAAAQATTGDTTGLAALADSIQRFGSRSAYGRDPRLHHFVRGLLHRLQGRPNAAVAAFRQAQFSPNTGYGRINLELARALLELGRADEAVTVLRAAFHGPLDASNLYVNRTTLQELLARAYDAAGRPDSAAAYYRKVLRAWTDADPQLAEHRARARRRLQALARAPTAP